MQVFRLMGMPDRVIAFDELPARFLKNFEMVRADGFPRHWKQYLGKSKRTIQIPPEKDLLTGQARYYDPIIEEDYFFYMLDWMVNPQVEKWLEICDYVKANVPKEFRVKEKIEDMALPLAPNKSDGVSLEPEDVVVIPLPPEVSEEATPKAEDIPSGLKQDSKNLLKCGIEGCLFEADGAYSKAALRLHKQKKHVAPAVI